MNKATFEYIPETPTEAVEETTPPLTKPLLQSVETPKVEIGELIALDDINPLEVFTVENGLEPFINKIKAQIESEVLDPSDEKGRTKIRSTARKVGSAKMRLKEMGQKLTEDWRTKTKAVTSEVSRMEKVMDALRDKVLQPVEEYEARVAERQQTFEQRLAELYATAEFAETPSAETVQSRLDKANSLYQYDWQEFQDRATNMYEQVKPKLENLLAERTKYEAEQAELQRFREAEELRKQKERDDQIAAEAAEKARKEAEEKAEADRKAAEVKAEAEKKALQDAADKAAKEAADKAAAEKKALEDKAEAERIAKEAAEKAAEEAAQKERNRIAAEEAAKVAEQKKREADQAHNAKINNEALAVILAVIDELRNQHQPDEEIAKAVVKAIAQGKVPHVKISY